MFPPSLPQPFSKSCGAQAGRAGLHRCTLACECRVSATRVSRSARDRSLRRSGPGEAAAAAGQRVLTRSCTSWKPGMSSRRSLGDRSKLGSLGAFGQRPEPFPEREIPSPKANRAPLVATSFFSMHPLPALPSFDNSGALSRRGQFSLPGRDCTLRTWHKSTPPGLARGFEVPGRGFLGFQAWYLVK